MDLVGLVGGDVLVPRSDTSRLPLSEFLMPSWRIPLALWWVDACRNPDFHQGRGFGAEDALVQSSNGSSHEAPTLAVTLGDVAGIGPEITAKICCSTPICAMS